MNPTKLIATLQAVPFLLNTKASTVTPESLDALARLGGFSLEPLVKAGVLKLLGFAGDRTIKEMLSNPQVITQLVLLLSQAEGPTTPEVAAASAMDITIRCPHCSRLSIKRLELGS